ncbi:hypothetical protein SCHPADRAFT_944623 [Schizopora paradoxa]|uniref:Uncharacterized protein n=1 Tax=Schizopora paradoxa TaxID=27342 RepID=A0A0H2R8Q6_9AGAM|nr:hypothetical protein SCHPADRAFT_944623 [Schizopora paradoxa]
MDRTKLNRDSMASSVEPMPRHESDDPSQDDIGLHSEGLDFVVDYRVVNFVTGLLERIQTGRTVGDLINLQVEWFDENTHCDASSNELRQALKLRRKLRRSWLVLRKLADCIENQVEQCTDRIKVLRARKIFSLLPDEILSIVLEYAAHSPEARRGDRPGSSALIKSVKNAIQLSSVSSRFRRVVLSSPNLWNRVCPGMSEEILGICFDRAKSSGLEIVVEMDANSTGESGPGDEDTSAFLLLVASVVRNLRSFEHRCFPKRYLFRVTSTSFPEARMGVLEMITRNLNAPRLQELSVKYINGPGDLFREGSQKGASNDEWLNKLHFYSTWTLPALRCMSATNIIPISFLGSSSIETLSINMDYYANGDPRTPERQFDADAFMAFLSSCKALKRLIVRLDSAKMSDEGIANRRNRVEMPSVEQFDLTVVSCCPHTTKVFMDGMHFTHLAEMGLIVECNERYHIEEVHMCDLM